MNRGKIFRVMALSLAAAPAFALAQTPPPPGRLLASNCFQCHGTNGRGGVETLAGKSASDIYKDMKEMRQKNSPEMMDMHARGFTDAEVQLIANYFASQR